MSEIWAIVMSSEKIFGDKKKKDKVLIKPASNFSQWLTRRFLLGKRRLFSQEIEISKKDPRPCPRVPLWFIAIRNHIGQVVVRADPIGAHAITPRHPDLCGRSFLPVPATRILSKSRFLSLIGRPSSAPTHTRRLSQLKHDLDSLDFHPFTLLPIDILWKKKKKTSSIRQSVQKRTMNVSNEEKINKSTRATSRNAPIRFTNWNRHQFQRREIEYSSRCTREESSLRQ